jgi:ABC-2 type transport system permease protein
MAVGRSRSQLYSSMLFPLMLLALLGTGVSDGLDPAKVRDGDYVSYLVPGMVVMTALFSSTFSSASYYRDRDSGMLRSFLVSPHSPTVILFGKSLSGVVIGSVQALLVLLIAAVIPGIDLDWQYGLLRGIVLAVAGILLLNVFLGGVAQVLASRISTMQGFHLVMNIVLFPFLFFSGAFFPLDDLPIWLRILGCANPLSYAVDLLHVAVYADTTEGYFGLAIDFGILGALAVGVYAWGLRRVPAMLTAAG